MEHEQTRAQWVADKIIARIGDNGLRPGDKIPTEKKLTEQFGVSRSTVREAIRLLVSRNVLETRHGSGTYISDSKGVVRDPLGLDLFHNKFKLTWDLLEIRLLLEPHLAYAAALNATDEQLECLEKLCDEMDFRSEKGLDRREIDTNFHMKILEASGNLVASNLHPILEKAVDMFIQYTARESTPETVATHREIMEALKQRDPQWASDVMRMHLIYNRNLFRAVAIERGEDFDFLKK